MGNLVGVALSTVIYFICLAGDGNTSRFVTYMSRDRGRGWWFRPRKSGRCDFCHEFVTCGSTAPVPAAGTWVLNPEFECTIACSMCALARVPEHQRAEDPTSHGLTFTAPTGIRKQKIQVPWSARKHGSDGVDDK
jgi:hypothetical protein